MKKSARAFQLNINQRKVLKLFQQTQMRRKADQQSHSIFSQSKRSKSKQQQCKILVDTLDQFSNSSIEKQNLKSINRVLNEDFVNQIHCRDKQKHQIQKFIVDAMNIGFSPQVFYIAGVPGIGKTLCVKHVIQKIQNGSKFDKQKNIFLFQNSFKVKQPRDIFKSILYHLCGYKADSVKALYILNDYFQNGKCKEVKLPDNVNKILVLDQMDYLKTDEYQVIYTIVQWIRSRKSRLSIIGISNQIDLPETFTTKIQSRFGHRRLIFPQYTYSQIQTILNTRLSQCEGVFSKKAVDYICHTISGQHTDIRKCLQILRLSVNKHLGASKYLEKAQRTPVWDIPQQIVQQASNQLFYDSFVDIYPQFPSYYKTILIALAKYFSEQQRFHISYSQLQSRLGSFITSINQLRSILFDLRDLGFISIKYQVNDRSNKISKEGNYGTEEEVIKLLVEVHKVFIAKDADIREKKNP